MALSRFLLARLIASPIFVLERGAGCTCCSISVPASALEKAERVEVQYRGVEVVGGTLADYEEDSFGGLVAKKGAPVLNKLYFDERLVLWQRSSDMSAEALSLPFSIAYPNANYPSECKSECKQAPSQSFEIAYHVIVWLVDADNEPVARVVQNMPFVPTFSRKPSPVRQAPLTQMGFDERGRECLFTRVTLSQADYVPGDQIVAGVYIECTKSNRTIRKAECTLRQRIECRMRRTFSPAETAEIASNSRPQSSQPSAASDDSDVLWSRMADVGQPQTLTLTTSGVGLAAAAASGGQTSASVIGSTISQTSDMYDVPDKRDSGLSRTMTAKSPTGIISGLRACSANMHTSIPASASMVSGHFLLFSYELQIDVTISSLGRSTQKIITHTPLGSTAGSVENGATTPTSASGFMLNRQLPCHRALVEAHAVSGSFSATATQFPQNVLQTPTSFVDDRDKVESFRKSRFSVGAFHTATSNMDNAASADKATEDAVSRRLSALKSAPIPRNGSVYSAFDTDGVDLELPNAVEQLRYRCEESLALVPKIFDPSKPAEPEEAAAEPESEEQQQAADSAAATELPEAGKPFIGTALKEGTSGDDKRHSKISNGSSDEFDLARAVTAAAEKVINDKEWDRPGSCYLPPKPSKRKSKGARAAAHALSGGGDASPSAPAAADTAVASDNSSNQANSSLEPRSSLESSRASSHFSDRDDIEMAISQLAPAKRQEEAETEEAKPDKRVSGLNHLIKGIDFLTIEEKGPELTGLLSADPSQLVFKTTFNDSLSQADAELADTEAGPPAAAAAAAAAGSDTTAYSPQAESAVLVQPGWTMFTPPPPAPQQITTSLRRSMSMPGNPAEVAELTAAAAAAAAAAKEDNMNSEEPTVARSAFESREYKTVLVRKGRIKIDAGRFSGMSPSSMISAMSSTSRLGGTSRTGVFRSFGQRFSSWFGKK
ncbi:hypothetical protein IWW40_003617 [Coemansia sp. RSA 1250]|nr:hypothetical protein IWW40_003617 [Coemansia sp. RSA 1250]